MSLTDGDRSNSELIDRSGTLMPPPDRPFKYILGHVVNIQEDLKHEFKLGQLKPSQMVNTTLTYVSAFLNAEGGTLYFGIEDTGRVLGVRIDRRFIDEVRQRLSQSMRRFSPIVYDDQYRICVEPVADETGVPSGRFVIEIEVSRGQEDELYTSPSGQVFVKRDASKDEIKSLSELWELARRRFARRNEEVQRLQEELNEILHENLTIQSSIKDLSSTQIDERINLSEQRLGRLRKIVRQYEDSLDDLRREKINRMTRTIQSLQHQQKSQVEKPVAPLASDDETRNGLEQHVEVSVNGKHLSSSSLSPSPSGSPCVSPTLFRTPTPPPILLPPLVLQNGTTTSPNAKPTRSAQCLPMTNVTLPESSVQDSDSDDESNQTGSRHQLRGPRSSIAPLGSQMRSYKSEVSSSSSANGRSQKISLFGVKLYNVSSSVTEADLRRLYEQFGPIANIPFSPAFNLAYVNFYNPNHAVQAVKVLPKPQLCNQVMVAELARPIRMSLNPRTQATIPNKVASTPPTTTSSTTLTSASTSSSQSTPAVVGDKSQTQQLGTSREENMNGFSSVESDLNAPEFLQNVVRQFMQRKDTLTMLTPEKGTEQQQQQHNKQLEPSQQQTMSEELDTFDGLNDVDLMNSSLENLEAMLLVQGGHWDNSLFPQN